MRQLDRAHEKVLKVNRHGYLNIGVPQQHELYLKSELKHKPIESITDYRSVMNFLFIRLWYYIFTERWIFTAPLRFGQFYIAESLNPTGFYKDWKASKEKGKVVKSYNFHSSGRKFYIKWDKMLAHITHKTYYRFQPYRGSKEEFTGKRGLAHWVQKCSEEPLLKDFRGHLI